MRCFHVHMGASKLQSILSDKTLLIGDSFVFEFIKSYLYVRLVENRYKKNT